MKSFDLSCIVYNYYMSTHAVIELHLLCIKTIQLSKVLEISIYLYYINSVVKYDSARLLGNNTTIHISNDQNLYMVTYRLR